MCITSWYLPLESASPSQDPYFSDRAGLLSFRIGFFCASSAGRVAEPPAGTISLMHSNPLPLPQCSAESRIALTPANSSHPRIEPPFEALRAVLFNEQNQQSLHFVRSVLVGAGPSRGLTPSVPAIRRTPLRDTICRLLCITPPPSLVDKPLSLASSCVYRILVPYPLFHRSAPPRIGFFADGIPVRTRFKRWTLYSRPFDRRAITALDEDSFPMLGRSFAVEYSPPPPPSLFFPSLGSQPNHPPPTLKRFIVMGFFFHIFLRPDSFDRCLPTNLLISLLSPPSFAQSLRTRFYVPPD